MWKLDPTSLHLFVAVCEEGSIARAGEREYIAASAVSKRIADIEQAIGTPLLLRSQRGVQPTAAGETLLHHARNFLRNLERLRAELSEYSAGIRGHVRILANISSVVEFLPEEITSFLQVHPQIRIDLEERVSGDIVRGIVEGSADIGICRDFVPMAGLTAVPYRSDHLAVVIPANHPLADRKVISFEETLDFEQIGLSLNASVNALMQRIAVEKGRELRYRMHVSTFDAAYRLIQAGLALGIIPMEVVGRYVDLYALRVIPLSDAWAKRNFVICIRGRDTLTVPARMLLQHLLEGIPATDEGAGEAAALLS